MAIKNQDFEMYASNDVELDLSLFDEDGDPLDLTGSTVRWALASAYDPTVPLVLKSSDAMAGILITDAVQGMVIVVLAAEDTAGLGGQPYVHEAAVTNDDGAETTVLTGAATIYKSAL
jgi:hypothetical protein